MADYRFGDRSDPVIASGLYTSYLRVPAPGLKGKYRDRALAGIRGITHPLMTAGDILRTR
jgi:hypothetical protein